MFKEWEVLYPGANVLLRCHRETKKSEVSPVMQEAAKSVVGKSEVRSKSKTKEKQELSSNCGGRKGMVFTGTVADHSRRWQQ